MLLALAAGSATAQAPGRAKPQRTASDLSRAPIVQASAAMGGHQNQPNVPPIDEKKATQLPSRDKIFTMYDDAALEKVILNRLRQDERDAGRDPSLKYGPEIKFPVLAKVGGDVPFRPRNAEFAPSRINYEPLYVIHRRLHFEELNSERYGWDLGIIQPFVSTFYFYKDVLLWPNSLASGCAYGFWDSSAGKCLPGSPTPYFLYPPGLTITGGAFEGVIITGAAFIFP